MKFANKVAAAKVAPITVDEFAQLDEPLTLTITTKSGLRVELEAEARQFKTDALGWHYGAVVPVKLSNGVPVQVRVGFNATIEGTKPKAAKG